MSEYGNHYLDRIDREERDDVEAALRIELATAAARIRELESAHAGIAGNDLPRPKMRDTSVGWNVATLAPVTVEEAAQAILKSKDARDAAFEAMWAVAEKHSLEATNSGGARYSITGDAVTELYYASLRALAGEGE